MKAEIARNSVVALQDHCSYKAPTANHHFKKNSESAGVSGLST